MILNPILSAKMPATTLAAPLQKAPIEPAVVRVKSSIWNSYPKILKAATI